jgi:1-aminocyclopropane-1-carboxylate deaminase
MGQSKKFMVEQKKIVPSETGIFYQTLSFPNGVEVVVKRLDAIDPEISGNKWYKLKYNIAQLQEAGHETLLTFGGAYSNHIAATAAAGHRFGFKTIGVIRGERPPALSHTLQKAESDGMRLEFITREAYSQKDSEDMKGYFREQFGSCMIVPEGGSNFMGINGCMEILSEEDMNHEAIVLACGTGATVAGILLSASENQYILGVPVFKNGSFLHQEVNKHLYYFLMDQGAAQDYGKRLTLATEYGFGGYGKWDQSLLDFMDKAKTQWNLPLDQVYTAKALYALYDLAEKKSALLQGAKRVLFIHTGGLQGLKSLV